MTTIIWDDTPRDLYHLLWTSYHDWQTGPGEHGATSIDQTTCPVCREGYFRDHPEARSLPICDPEWPGESLHGHGARVLKFILETSCTATLSDRELAHADLAAHYALIARGILPLAATRLSDARHLIQLMLRARKQEESERAQLHAVGGQLEGKLGTGGPGDREPIVPTPKTEPPVGVVINPRGMYSAMRDRVQF